MPTGGGDLVKWYLQKEMMDLQLKTRIITLADNYQVVPMYQAQILVLYMDFW